MGQYKIKDLDNYIESIAYTFEDAVSAINEKGGSASTEQGLTILPDAIRSIPSGGSVEDYIDFSANQAITENGEFPLELIDGKYAGNIYVDVQGSGAPDYRYMNGTVDRDGLRAIGWTEEDILRYEQNSPHYSSVDYSYMVSEENKNLYQLDDPKPSLYKDDSRVTFVPNKNMGAYFTKSEAFYNLKFIKGLHLYDTSGVTNMTRFFQSCSALTSIPPLDTSNVTNMYNMFQSCYALTSIPLLDTSNVTNMYYMFSNCRSLTNIPQLDTSNVTDMRGMFSGCNALTSIPPLDTSNVTDMSNIFSGCNSLATVAGIDFSGLTQEITRLFASTSMLYLTHFIVNGKLNVSISDNYGFKACTNLDYESIKSILVAASRTDNTDAKSLAFSRTMSDPDGELQNIITICNGKGWTITGLTLN